MSRARTRGSYIIALGQGSYIYKARIEGSYI